jgi:hypothetical protein
MRVAGWTFGSAQVCLLALPAIAIAGCATWMMLPGPSDAESQTMPPASTVLYAQNVSLVDPAAVPAESNSAGSEQPSTPAKEATAPAAVTPPPEMATTAKPLIDGLKISSQSWRRGGLGSKALVTLTLRNANDYAVKDIEIACAFARRDGSHLTDRRRVIADTVNMRSRKTYSGMLIGFVNVNANKAKCSLVTASRT